MGHDKQKRPSTSSSSSSRNSSPDHESEPRDSIPTTILVKHLKTKKKHRSSADSPTRSDSDSSTHRESKKSKSNKKSRSREDEEESPKKHKKPKLEKQHDVSPLVAGSLPPTTDMRVPGIKDTRSSEKTKIDSSSCDVQSSALLAEILCEFADFATSIAQKISLKAEYPWTPLVLRSAKASGKTKEPKDPNGPRRPLSSYTLWSNHIRKKTKKEQPDRPALKMSELADMWKQTPSEQKARWEQEAKNVRTQYNKEVEMYNQKKSKNTATNDINKKAV